ncbi:hypothetical protein L2E82_32721 [Cichorium intybus]|uniref:Uncharacterized protein n=1 Tax=Cichorium intybus TaxID=13427 RepID=A0ACB9BI81_CICIN|nr:hypothetical protein L2E82_32721 [Cichorium intybus]
MFTVLEVNEPSYKNCTDQGFIFNITIGNGSDVFELTQPKRYYFSASGGYCYNDSSSTSPASCSDFDSPPSPKTALFYGYRYPAFPGTIYLLTLKPYARRSQLWYWSGGRFGYLVGATIPSKQPPSSSPQLNQPSSTARHFKVKNQ